MVGAERSRKQEVAYMYAQMRVMSIWARLQGSSSHSTVVISSPNGLPQDLARHTSSVRIIFYYQINAKDCRGLVRRQGRVSDEKRFLRKNTILRI